MNAKGLEMYGYTVSHINDPVVWLRRSQGTPKDCTSQDHNTKTIVKLNNNNNTFSMTRTFSLCHACAILN